MKKTYNSPEMTVIMIAARNQMLIQSLPGVDPTQEPISPGTVGSRRRHYEDWDDEDEEDF